MKLHWIVLSIISCIIGIDSTLNNKYGMGCFYFLVTSVFIIIFLNDKDENNTLIRTQRPALR